MKYPQRGQTNLQWRDSSRFEQTGQTSTGSSWGGVFTSAVGSLIKISFPLSAFSRQQAIPRRAVR
jgi:hypothetical protein